MRYRSLQAAGVLGVALAGVAAAAALHAVVRRATRARYSLDRRTVLITGGARGLGLALARRLASDGARLVLVSRSPEDLERAALELRNRGVEVLTRVCDVRDEASVEALVRDVVEATGRLDVLVNNAGVIQVAPFANTMDDDYRESLAIHFWAPLHLIRHALPHLEARGGRIVNISSVGGRVAVPHLLPYCVGKFALTALSDGLNAELASRGVHVVTVTPSLMRTGSHRNALIRGQHEAEARWFGLAASLPGTAMPAERAADEIVRALVEGRARVAPGVQAAVATMANELAPETVSAARRVANRLLPSASQDPDGHALRRSRDLDLGWTARFMSTDAAIALNQTVAQDELAASVSRRHEREAGRRGSGSPPLRAVERHG
jgi:NAD(P)-dependent dehydrogenase (short-subunit alcohol dehydrogenase family)